MKYKKNKKIYITLTILLIFIALVVMRQSGPKEDTEVKKEQQTVSLFTVQTGVNEPLTTVCNVESVESPQIQSEASGQVQQVRVEENEEVGVGQTLFVLENVDESLTVQEAQIEVEKAQAALDELIRENSLGDQGARLEVATEQQKQIIDAARSSLLNNDLQAYPAESQSFGDLQGSAPVVSGSYSCDKEGDYVIEVYSSNSESGFSYRYEGLESGVALARSNFPVQIGSCGLSLTLPDDARSDRDWIISIPNKRSSTYTTTLDAYESALAGRDVALEQAEVSPEQITQARQRLEQSQLRLRSAQNQLAKTYIKAPISGVFIESNLDNGDFVSIGQIVGSIRKADQLQATTFITEDEIRYVGKDTAAQVGGFEGTINNVGSILLSTAQKIKVEILLEEDTPLTEGDSVECSLTRTDQSVRSNETKEVIIPLSAIAIVGVDTFIFMVDENGVLSKKEVQTGALLGDKIVVVEGVSHGDIIIRDVRGVREGQQAVIE